MNKLWIFGDSHSTPHGIKDSEFWGVLLAKKLGLKNKGVKFGETGDGGSGIDVILLNIMTVLKLDLIKPNDVVIFNASYSGRVGATHFSSLDIEEAHRFTMSKITGELKFETDPELKRLDENKRVKNEFSGGRLPQVALKNFKLKPSEVIFFQWYLRQSLAYEILKNTEAKVYQWLLEPKEDLEYLINNCKVSESQDIQNFEAYYNELKKTHQGWENLIECPVLRHHKKVKCWSDVFRLSYPISNVDSHMNKEGHKFFVDELYKQISSKE
jgi:hypothetical protein